jgi:uncharacterized protein (DUF58 family)
MNNSNNMNRPGEGLVFSSLESLLKQQARARVLKRGRRGIRAHQLGQHLSVHKGRGMDFAESRLYQPGDDIRLLDWRVTARTGKTHTKVFQEERERPVLLWIDLRPSMFFATRGRFKSVIVAELASLLIWKSWLDGDRVGGLITTGHQYNQFRPTRSKAGILQIMKNLADKTLTYTANQEQKETRLAPCWQRLRRIVTTGTQVIMISDFRGMDEQAEQQLVAISRKATIDFIQITDPFEKNLPKKGKLNLTDGRHFLKFNLQHWQSRKSYIQHANERHQHLLEFSRKYRAGLIEVSTSNSSRKQLIILKNGLM